MFFNKQKNEMTLRMQENNRLLANLLTQISEGNTKHNEEVMLKTQENNQLLANVLTQISENNTKHNEEVMLKTQENNQLLAGTLAQIVEFQAKQNSEEEMEFDPWVAAYALNLCTISVSQIIENNDLRYMEQEYDNILNNLNLETMPKDEALLDVLKQILDVINFFKIQSKEKALLDKEYQQKLKDAVWSAVPSPSVILSGGKSGWVALAISAAVTVGTGYMNYRKEKAKINNEQERKKWELERSAMEQLHGLQRQLFETAWRLAKEYKFEDVYRLSERQIKQYNEILCDQNLLRRYERLWYIQDKFDAYPPFWYYMGSAALQFAKESENEEEICREYLFRARDCFNEFYKKTEKGLRVLREDPIVAQCTFEYIATLNMLEDKQFLSVDAEKMAEISKKKIDRLDEARNSCGNSCDVLQQCALNYLALGENAEAIKIMIALINERYNVSSNAQFLSVFYVKQYLSGDSNAKNAYKLLERKPIGSAVLYPMISYKSEEKRADEEFLIKLKISLAQKYLTTIKKYSNDIRDTFLGIWDKNYDITEETLDLFNKLADDINGIISESSYRIISRSIKAVVGTGKNGMADLLSGKEKRNIAVLDSLIKGIFEEVTKTVIEDIDSVTEINTFSKEESKVLAFCEKQKIVLNERRRNAERKLNTQSIESALLGKKAITYVENKEMVEEYIKAVECEAFKNNILNTKKGLFVRSGDAKAEFITAKDRIRFDSCKNEFSKNIDKNAAAFAIVRYNNRHKQDLIFTTKGLYVLEPNTGSIQHELYSDLSCDKNGKGIVIKTRPNKVIYERSAVNYEQLFKLIAQLAEIEGKYIKQNDTEGGINIGQLVHDKIDGWQMELNALMDEVDDHDYYEEV